MADLKYIPPPRGSFTQEDRDALEQYQGILEESPLSEREHVRHDVAPAGTRVLQEQARVARMHLVQSYGPGLNVIGDEGPSPGLGGLTGGIRTGRRAGPRGATERAPTGRGAGPVRRGEYEGQTNTQGLSVAPGGGAAGTGGGQVPSLTIPDEAAPALQPREQPQYRARVRTPEPVGGGLGRPGLSAGQRRILGTSGGSSARFARPFVGPSVATIRQTNPMAMEDPIEIGLLRNAVRAKHLSGLGGKLGDRERMQGQDKILDERQQLLAYRQERKDKSEQDDRDDLEQFYKRVRELAKEIPEGSEKPLGHERAAAIALPELRAFRPGLVERMGSGSREDQQRFVGRHAAGMGPTTISESERAARERIAITREQFKYGKQQDFEAYLGNAAQSVMDLGEVAAGRHDDFKAGLGAHLARARMMALDFAGDGIHAGNTRGYERFKQTMLSVKNPVAKLMTHVELGAGDTAAMLKAAKGITLEQMIGEVHPQTAVKTQGVGTLIPEILGPLLELRTQAIQEGNEKRAGELRKIVTEIEKKLPPIKTASGAVEAAIQAVGGMAEWFVGPWSRFMGAPGRVYRESVERKRQREGGAAARGEKNPRGYTPEMDREPPRQRVSPPGQGVNQPTAPPIGRRRGGGY